MAISTYRAWWVRLYQGQVSHFCRSQVPSSSRPKSTLSSTVRCGNSEYFWKTMPRRRSGCVTGAPLAVTVPFHGASEPSTMRSSVDLPQPLGPMTLRKSWCGTRRLTSSMTTWWPPLGLG
jgi:hypothetical protein